MFLAVSSNFSLFYWPFSYHTSWIHYVILLNFLLVLRVIVVCIRYASKSRDVAGPCGDIHAAIHPLTRPRPVLCAQYAKLDNRFLSDNFLLLYLSRFMSLRSTFTNERSRKWRLMWKILVIFGKSRTSPARVTLTFDLRAKKLHTGCNGKA